MTSRILLVSCLCLLVALPAAAQGRPNPDVQREAMKKLAFLAGRWTGDVSVTMGPGYTSGPATVKNVMTLDEAGRWVECTDVVVNNGPPRRTVEIRVSK